MCKKKRLMNIRLTRMLGTTLATWCFIANPLLSQERDTSNLTAQEVADWKRQAAIAISSPTHRNRVLQRIDEQYADLPVPDAIRMLRAILTTGGRMRGSDGWFGPAESKFDWSWLTQKHGISESDSVTPQSFRGSERLFSRLDRDRNGRLQAADFDWSDQNPWVLQTTTLNRVFRTIDVDGDDRVNAEEWELFFRSVRSSDGAFSSEQFRDRILRSSGGYLSGDEPTVERLLKGLFNGELGSIHCGPSVGDAAIDFELMTQDETATIRLTSMFGSKPTVLIFGNFTCGPYRRLYPEVDDISKRFRDDANFLAIYVRESHPEDGWSMQSNALDGVSVVQPRTFGERKVVAQQCFQRLRYSMPLLVDSIDDAVGHAYSGMPSRLYVIDRQGTIVFKSGRGPFGFLPGEMEQALVLTLLDQTLDNK